MFHHTGGDTPLYLSMSNADSDGRFWSRRTTALVARMVADTSISTRKDGKPDETQHSQRSYSRVHTGDSLRSALSTPPGFEVASIRRARLEQRRRELRRDRRTYSSQRTLFLHSDCV